MAEDKSLESMEVPWFLRSGPRLFGILFLTLAIPLTILAFSLIAQIKHATRERLVNENSASARLIAQTVSEHLSGLISVVESYSNRPSLINALEKENYEELFTNLSNLRKMKKEFASVEILDLSGKIIAIAPKLKNDQIGHHSNEDWFKTLDPTKKNLSSVHPDPHQNNGNLITISVPLLNANKEPIGHLVAHYSVSNLSKTLQWLKPSSLGSFYLIDDKGTVISHESSKQTLINRDNVSLFYNIFKGETKTSEGISPLTNLPSFLSYHPIGSTGWMVVATHPTTIVSNFLNSLYLPIFSMVFLSLLVMFGLGALWLNAIRRYHIQRNAIQQDLLQKAEEVARYRVDVDQLKSFAFITSHDLQEPIHHLHRLGEKLRNQTKDKLNPECEAYLAQILESTETMGHLADQLRDFAKSDSEALVFEKVDMNQVVNKVLEEFKEKIAETAASIENSGLPIVRADRNQMEIVMRNVIDNALTFRKDNIPPKIQFSSIPLSKGFVEILVHDDGIGFEEKHVDEIFRPFHRLDSTHKYPGSGLGLAISRRIILRHGGVVSARSSPSKGTTIVIMLPS